MTLVLIRDTIVTLHVGNLFEIKKF